MAAVGETLKIDFSLMEKRLQDQMLEVFRSTPKDVELFRPSLGEQHKVGFFSLDQSSQTDITEVLDLKEMTIVLKTLLKDTAELKRDLSLAKQLILAEYHKKFKEKSIELYCRINSKVTDLEKLHEEKVMVIRKAFKQQLVDALSRVTSIYTHDVDLRLEKMMGKKRSEHEAVKQKCKDLQMTIQRNETIIQMLKMQLAQFTNKPPSEDDVDEVESIRTPSPQFNEEADMLRGTMDIMTKKITRLEEAIDIKDDQASQLHAEIVELTAQNEKSAILIEQLKHEHKSLMSNAELDKADAQKSTEGEVHSDGEVAQSHDDVSQSHMSQIHDSQSRTHLNHDSLHLGQTQEGGIEERDLNKQQAKLEKEMEEKLKKMKDEMLGNAEKDEVERREREAQLLLALQNEKKQLEKDLEAEKTRKLKKTQEMVDFERAKELEGKLRSTIAWLKAEIIRINRAWEKKFTVLQMSMHALKDESYLRQHLQRQAATLHQAAVSYAIDTPIGIRPSKNMNNEKKRLPEIQKGGKSEPERDYISYTVSAAGSGRASRFSYDEHQVMADTDQDDIPNDIPPLPAPPAALLHSPVNSSSHNNRGPGSNRAYDIRVPSAEG